MLNTVTEINALATNDVNKLIYNGCDMKTNYEVIELIKDDKWDEKAMYVIMDDAKDIYNGIKRLNYIRYWNDYCNELSDAIKDLPLSATYTQSEELKKAEEIRNNIGEFLSRVADSNNPSVENVISRIIERIEK